MGERANRFIAFIPDAPTVEITKSIARIRDRSGNVQIERAMPVHSFAKYVERAQRALDRYAAGEENVIVDD